jgi:hypothetical protein
MFAILLGVGAAFIRRFVSNFKKKMLLKSWVVILLNKFN